MHEQTKKFSSTLKCNIDANLLISDHYQRHGKKIIATSTIM